MPSLLPLPTFSPNDWQEIEATFRTAPIIPLQVVGTVPGGRTVTRGEVQAGWQEGWLWVFATLEDYDIGTTASAHNQWMWERGDVLEVFVRREGETAYREVHVTPNNWCLLLEFPDDRTIRRLRSGEETDLARYCGNPLSLRSQARAEPRENRWRALVGIPLETMAEQIWHLSFCRYDAAIDQKPVTYSTTSFTVPDFHRQEEWEAYTLIGLPVSVAAADAAQAKEIERAVI